MSASIPAESAIHGYGIGSPATAEMKRLGMESALTARGRDAGRQEASEGAGIIAEVSTRRSKMVVAFRILALSWIFCIGFSRLSFLDGIH